MDAANARRALAAEIEARGVAYATPSRALGRNAAYIQQYIQRGVPRRLSPDDLAALARHLGCPPTAIGAPADRVRAADGTADFIRVPLLGARAPEPGVAFHAGWVGALASAHVDALALVAIDGDAMAPTLGPGDMLLIDTADAGGGLRDGVYALQIEGAVVIKRLAVGPASARVVLSSDNSAYPAWPDCDPAQLTVLGRAVWTGRRLR